MKAALRKQLLQLGRRQQNRIWLNRIISRMPPLLWWSASVLFLGGCIHQLISPLEPLIIACIAILPSLLIFCWISARVKPAADEGAAAADRLLEANSLFVSAWELTHTTTAIKGISRLLLRRTEKELPDWSKHINRQAQRYMKPASLAATSLGLVGLLFLLVPTQVQTSKVSSAEVTSATAQRKPVKLNQDPAVVLSKLFTRKTVTAAAEQHHQQSSQPGPSKGTDSAMPLQSGQAVMAKNSGPKLNTDEQMATQKSARTSTLDETLSPALNVLQPGLRSRDGKKIAERTAGNETADSTNTLINKTKKFDRVSLIDIETGTDRQNTAFDSSQEGEKLIVSTAAQSSFQQSTGSHSQKVSQTDSATLLSAEQRTLVWRYFKQLEKINEASK